MKHIFQSILFGLGILLVATTSVNAQENGAFNNGFSLKLMYTSATSGFSNMNEFNTNSTGFAALGPVWEKNNPGFGLKLGSMFFLNGIRIHEKIRIGLDVTYMGFNYISSEMRISPNQTFNIHNIYFNPEFGPSFSFSPVDDMSIDVSFKASLVVDINFGSYNYTVANSEFSDTYLGAGIGFRYGPALY